MTLWLREIGGWVLIGLGLFIFYSCFVLLMAERPLIFQAGPLTFIGFVVFRGGIHLLKVAVAARVCGQAQQHLREERQTPAGPGRRHLQGAVSPRS